MTTRQNQEKLSLKTKEKNYMKNTIDLLTQMAEADPKSSKTPIKNSKSQNNIKKQKDKENNMMVPAKTATIQRKPSVYSSTNNTCLMLKNVWISLN